MKTFVLNWLHNLWVTLLIVIGVGIFMLIFMGIFYPQSLSAMSLIGQTTGQIITIFRLWPIVVLAIIVSALPRRRRR